MEKMEEIVMKNIQERAKEAYPINEYSIIVGVMIRGAYIRGAKEQKAIDIEKAKTAFSKACGWLSTYPWYNEVFEEFIKAMEE